MKYNIIKTLIIAGTLVASTQAQTVNERRENQQDRIAQGVKSGQLTARETAHLEHREAKVNREVRRDKAAHGGHLTAGERARVQHQQNKLSRSIYRDKHNGQVQH